MILETTIHIDNGIDDIPVRIAAEVCQNSNGTHHIELREVWDPEGRFIILTPEEEIRAEGALDELANKVVFCQWCLEQPLDACINNERGVCWMADELRGADAPEDE